MMSQLTQFVSLFNGSNWGQWLKQMRAYLMAHGQGTIVSGASTEPVVPAAPGALNVNASAAEINTFNEAIHARDRAIANQNEWCRLNDMAIGNITLRLAPAIQQKILSENNAVDLWEGIKNLYSKHTLPFVYKDFKEAISLRFNLNQHLAAQFDKLAAAFALGKPPHANPANQSLN